MLGCRGETSPVTTAMLTGRVRFAPVAYARGCGSNFRSGLKTDIRVSFIRCDPVSLPGWSE
jgi:hypothetical protein